MQWKSNNMKWNGTPLVYVQKLKLKLQAVERCEKELNAQNRMKGMKRNVVERSEMEQKMYTCRIEQWNDRKQNENNAMKQKNCVVQ